MESSKTGKGIALVLLAACLWGISGTVSQFLFQQRGVEVDWLVCVRMLLAGVLLVGISRARPGADTFGPWSNRSDATQLLIFGLLGMLTVQYTYFLAIAHSNAATATVLQFTGPVFIAGYFWIRERKPLKGVDMLAIAAALLGTFLLVTHGDPGHLAISKQTLLYGLGSAVSLAIYTLQPAALLQKFHATTVIGWGLVIGGLGMCAFQVPWHVTGTWDALTYGACAFVVLFGTLVPFYAYLLGAKSIGGQQASLLTSAEPLSAAVLSVFWLGVPFQLLDYVGTALIISTVFLLGLARRQTS